MGKHRINSIKVASFNSFQEGVERRLTIYEVGYFGTPVGAYITIENREAFLPEGKFTLRDSVFLNKHDLLHLMERNGGVTDSIALAMMEDDAPFRVGRWKTKCVRRFDRAVPAGLPETMNVIIDYEGTELVYVTLLMDSKENKTSISMQPREYRGVFNTLDAIWHDLKEPENAATYDALKREDWVWKD